MIVARTLLGNRARVLAVLVASFIGFSASPSQAIPIVCEPPYCVTWDSGVGATGNSYSFVSLAYTTTWTEADALARAAGGPEGDDRLGLQAAHLFERPFREDGEFLGWPARSSRCSAASALLMRSS